MYTISTLCALQTQNILRDKFASLYNNTKYADVIFKVGNSTFYGNRAIIACQSDVLHTLLYSKFFAESHKNNIVLIDDISPKAFEYLLQTFYAMNPRLTNENSMDVYYACEKYMLHNLQQSCGSYINRYMFRTADLFVHTILTLKNNGLYEHFCNNHMRLNYVSQFGNDRKQYNLLLENPKLLYFDHVEIEYLLFKTKLFTKTDYRDRYITSMESQWIFIDKYSKFQIVLQNEERPREVAQAKVDLQNENNDEKENAVESLDVTDENEQNYNAILKSTAVQKVYITDKSVIEKKIKSLDMNDESIKMAWALMMMKFIKYIDLNAMNSVLFAHAIWPKIQAISTVTGNGLADKLVKALSRKSKKRRT